SDIVFVFAWLPFVLGGAAGQPALDHELARQAAARAAARTRPARARAPGSAAARLAPVPAAAAARTRRELLGRALAVTGAGTLLVGGLSALLKGRYRGGSSVRALAGGEAAHAAHRAKPTTSGSHSGTTAGSPAPSPAP